ncbi:hypothetical protein PFISCL1PPCAC_7610, partial [Pristionchus fissidentatus]
GTILHETITVEARIYLIKSSGLRDTRRFDFSQASDMSDVVLKVEGKSLNVNKTYLALCSPFFSAFFDGPFAEFEKDQIELKDVSYEEFVTLLSVVYPSREKINVDNVESLLKLDDCYDSDFVVKAAEDFLVSACDNFSNAKLLLLSDLYRLPKLQGKCLAYYSLTRRVKALKKTPEYKQLSAELKATLLDKVLDDQE